MSQAAVNVPTPRIVSTEDAVELIWQAVLAGDYTDSAAAARDLWRTFRFSQDSLDFLGLFGLIALAQSEQRGTRGQAKPGESARPAIGWGAPHGKDWDRYIALTWVYEAADGQQKSLVMFNRDDLAAFATRCRNLATSWKQRAKWSSDTLALCVEHEAASVGDLPADVLAQVNDAAREAMGRRQ